MYIIYRYLLRQFVQIFLICFVSLMGLFVVVDAFQHLDGFGEQAKKSGSLAGVLVEYYGYRCFDFFDRTSGMLAMLAAMFTVTWLQRHQEMTALMAAGVSKVRVIKPLLLAGVAISLLAAANREIAIPSVREELARDSRDLGGAGRRNVEARFDNHDVLIGGEVVIASEEKIVHPSFILPPTLSTYGKQLLAREAIHQPRRGETPPGYLLRGVTSPEGLLKAPALRIDEVPVILTPEEVSWLGNDEIFVVSDLSFSMLADGSTWKNLASTGELISELHNPSTDLGPDIRVAVHRRLVQPLMDGTLLMLGLPLMFSRRQGNVFLTVGVCLLVALSFSVATLACQSLGGLGMLRPSLAAWLPLLAFVPVAAALSDSLRS